MDTIDCHSTIRTIDDNFEKLATYTSNAQDYINSWQLKNQMENYPLFDSLMELLEPLEKLSQLIVSIYDDSQSNFNDDQLKVLIIWMRSIALSYCFAQHFMQINDRAVDKNKLAYQFYHYISSELRTPFVMSGVYSKMLQSASNSQSESNLPDQFAKQVLAPPFIPHHRDTLVQIDHWIKRLLKFIETLITQIAKGGNYEH